jgi:hypothetical protein
LIDDARLISGIGQGVCDRAFDPASGFHCHAADDADAQPSQQIGHPGSV